MGRGKGAVGTGQGPTRIWTIERKGKAVTMRNSSRVKATGREIKNPRILPKITQRRQGQVGKASGAGPVRINRATPVIRTIQIINTTPTIALITTNTTETTTDAQIPTNTLPKNTKEPEEARESRKRNGHSHPDQVKTTTTIAVVTETEMRNSPAVLRISI